MRSLCSQIHVRHAAAVWVNKVRSLSCRFLFLNNHRKCESSSENVFVIMHLGAADWTKVNKKANPALVVLVVQEEAGVGQRSGIGINKTFNYNISDYYPHFSPCSSICLMRLDLGVLGWCNL